MKLYIPSIGDKIKLSRDWTFTLHAEWRNRTLAIMTGHLNPTTQLWSDNRDMYGDRRDANGYRIREDAPYTLGRPIATITLPKGTVLTVDRIYIRKGAEAFDSLSFWLSSESVKAAFGKKGKARFWAKLTEVNTIEFTPVT